MNPYRWLPLARTSIFVLLSGLVLGASAAGPKAYVGNFKDDTVSVIDTSAGAVIATVPVAKGPHGMSVTPDGRWVYVSGEGSSSVSVIQTSSDRVVHTIDVGGMPHGLAMAPDGKMLLVGVYPYMQAKVVVHAP